MNYNNKKMPTARKKTFNKLNLTFVLFSRRVFFRAKEQKGENLIWVSVDLWEVGINYSF